MSEKKGTRPEEEKSTNTGTGSKKRKIEESRDTINEGGAEESDSNAPRQVIS